MKLKKSLILLAASLSICFLIRNILEIFGTTNYINLYNRVINKQPQNICNPLTDKILSLINNQSNDWSISIMNKHGELIVDINGNKLRIPASNQKLVTTAYALDKLPINFSIKTSLYLNKNGDFELRGGGDPDLNIDDIYNFSYEVNSLLKDKRKSSYKLYIYEEDKKYWWPKDWHPFDRDEDYGAPITRLALLSNSYNQPFVSHLDTIKNIFNSEVNNNYLEFTIRKRNIKFNPFPITRRLISQTKSAPFISLMSLSNSESHNFTAEVLLKHAAREWDTSKATERALFWLTKQGINTTDFILTDGSGLSRTNKLTTNSLALLLYKMNSHRYSHYYRSSLAISGLRGTLTNLFYDNPLKGRFYGKTGTLRGIRSISGILDTPSSEKYISVIGYNHDYADETIRKILNNVYYENQCS